MTTAKLNMQSSVGLCELIEKMGSKVQFFFIDFEDLFRSTPLETVWPKFERITNFQNHPSWLSDILRYSLIFRYGGFFSDLDVVFLKNISSLNNVFMINAFWNSDLPRNCVLQEGKQKYAKGLGTFEVSSGQFHLEKNHRFAWIVMKLIQRFFDPKSLSRILIGPAMPTKALHKLYKTQFVSNFNSPQFSLLPSYTALPFWDHTDLVWSNHDRHENFYHEMTRCSYMAHVFNSHTGRLRVRGNPKREFYSYIGPKVCPIAFQHLNTF